MIKCKRCGWNIPDTPTERLSVADFKKLESVSLCHSCHHVLLAVVANAEYRKEIEKEGYTGWDNWVKNHG